MGWFPYEIKEEQKRERNKCSKKRKRQRQSGESQYQKMLCPWITSLSLTVKVITREMSSAFQTVQASSSKLFTCSESDSHGSQMAITEMVSVLNCTSNSNGGKTILCHLDHGPRLLFSDLMGSWYTSKISLISVEENMSGLHLNISACLRFPSGAAAALILPREEFWLWSMWFWSLLKKYEKGKGEWRPVQTTNCRHMH